MEQPLFDLRQRAYDGKWCVWVTRTDAELGTIEAYDPDTKARKPMTYQEYVAGGSYPWLNQTRQVCVGVYEGKPKVQEVLTLAAFRRSKMK